MPDSTADFESARRGSIPRRGAGGVESPERRVQSWKRQFATGRPALDSGLSAPAIHVLGVCRIARDSAKVEDQVRFLARTLDKTLEPDGTATGCNPVQVGSTPTGVSEPAGPTAPAAPSSCEAVGDVCSVHGF